MRTSQKAGGNARCRSAIRFVVLSNLRFGRICTFGDAPSFCLLLDDFPHSAIIPAFANPTDLLVRVLVGPEVFAGTYQLQQRIVANRIHPVGILRHRVVAVRMFDDVGLARSAPRIPPGPAASAGPLCGEGSATSLAPIKVQASTGFFQKGSGLRGISRVYRLLVLRSGDLPPRQSHQRITHPLASFSFPYTQILKF